MIRAFALSIVAAISLPASAVGQQKPDLTGEKTLANFAECMVRAAPVESGRIIATLPGSTDEQVQLDQLLRRHGKCLTFSPSIADDQLSAAASLGQMTVAQAAAQAANQQRQMRFSRQAMRGAIATRLYLDLANRKSGTITTSGEIDDREAGLPVGYVVVRCAVAQDPVAADRLVRSQRLSPAEAEAGRAFAPALNRCVRGHGRVDMSGTAIHGWAAEALYKHHETTGAR